MGTGPLARHLLARAKSSSRYLPGLDDLPRRWVDLVIQVLPEGPSPHHARTLDALR